MNQSQLLGIPYLKNILLSISAITALSLYCKYLHEYILMNYSMMLSNYTTKYKKKFRPRRIILVRHGESKANVNKQLWSTVPDSKIDLTDQGIIQAEILGKKLRNLIGDNSKVKFFVSPFLRTMQTYRYILKSFDERKCSMIQEPTIREQERGNLQDAEQSEIDDGRYKVGRFFFRYKEGESGADVYDRASSFLASLYRNMDNFRRAKYDNYVVVTHGLFIRLFLTRYLRLSIEEFETLKNPGNCEMIILEKNSSGAYELVKPLEKVSESLMKGENVLAG